MRLIRYLAVLSILLVPAAAYSHAQVSVGVGIGGPVYYGGYAILLPSALMATTATILTPARPTDTTARRGLPAASLSVPAPGTATDGRVTATAATTAIAAATMDALATLDTQHPTLAEPIVAAMLPEQFIAATPAEQSAAVMLAERPEADSPAAAPLM